MTTLKDKLRELRQRAGMTQEDVAERLDVSSQTVSKWERGILSPDIMLLPQIAILYRTSIDSLFNMESAWDENHQREFEAKIESYYKVKDYESAYRAWITEINLNPDNFSYYARVMYMVFFEKLLDDAHIKRMLMLTDHAEKYCFDTDIKNEIYLRMLMICSNSESGNFKSEALNFYNKLPKLRHSRELLEYMISTETDGNKLIKKNIMILVSQLEWEVQRLIVPGISVQEKLQYCKKSEEILRFVTDEKYGGIFDGQLLISYSNIIPILIEQKHESEAMRYVEKVIAIIENHMFEEKRKECGILYEDIFPYEVDGMLKICRSILHCLEGISAFEEEKNKLFILAEQYEKNKYNKI
jgi:transcriptional regulator with XRE-family HTH domain